MKKFVSTLLLLVTLTFTAQAINKDIELLRARFAQAALQGRVNPEHVKERMKSLKEDGSWPDIDYIDTSRIAFQHSQHLSHLMEMVRAYKQPKSPLKGNRQLKKKIDLALGFWLEHDFQGENWQPNQISTPSQMLNMLFILDKELTKQQQEAMLRIAGRANMDAPGARPSGDRVRVISLYAQSALFRRDEQLVIDIMKIIEGELAFYNKEAYEKKLRPTYFSGGHGMEPDFSFHHRPDQVNNTSTYGAGFATAFTDWAVKVADTQYRFSDKAIHQLVDYYLDGMCKQMAFGRQIDPGVKNRDIARPNGHRAELAGNYIPESLLKITDYRKDELTRIISIRKGEDSYIAPFAKFFWNTEHFVFQRPTWYTSVRMFSTRNANMEKPYNGEGLTNHYRADGANYLTITGNEYNDIYSTFDFRKVPGATIQQADTMPDENNIQHWGLTDFVGGVTDGMYGAVAFDFISPIDLVKAKKAWFFFDDQYVCLGAGISNSSKAHVCTTINQCFLNGDVTVGNTNNETKVLDKGNRMLNHLKWVHHNNVGYIILSNKANIGLQNETLDGSWTRVNRQVKARKWDKTKEDEFTLWFDHGGQINNATYAYTVLPNTSIDHLKQEAANASTIVLANTPKLQAVNNPSAGIAYAVFYAGGSIDITDKIRLTSDTQALIMVKHKNGKAISISVADPGRSLLKLHLSINERPITIKLPQAEWAGSSVTHDL